MHALREERFVGIEEFYTKSRGIGGKLRFIPEDFEVTELSLDIPEVKDGDFVIVRVKAKNWETNHLIGKIAKELRISKKRIGFAGTKDRRAVTTQFISIYWPEEKIIMPSFRDVKFDVLYRSDRKLRIGELKGNRFFIRIREIEDDMDITRSLVEDILEELKGIFPNFYGIQRFGTVRPVTHMVGKCIIQGDFEKAVEMYITYHTELENEEERMARKRFARERNAKKALEYFPQYLSFERSLLNGLIEHKSHCRALQNLPDNLIIMFVYAYQSYIFNRILSERIRRKLPINSAIEGDLILPEGENKTIPVNEKNIDKINRALKKGKCSVTGLLPGYDVNIAGGEMGEIEHKILEEEKIDVRNFIIPEIPFLSSSGSRRSLAATVEELRWKTAEDSLNRGKSAIEMEFFLEKGTYATSFLREIMKADNITRY